MAERQTPLQFQKDIAELISLISKASCPGTLFVKNVISSSSTRLDMREMERMGSGRMQNGAEELFISVKFDEERQDLIVEDNGTGFPQKELINLGGKQYQGTKAVISALTNSPDRDLGEIKKLFDVEFFTVFAVADKVTITSKHNGESGWYAWTSEGTEHGFIVQQIQNPGLSCTTQITLHLKKHVAENIKSMGLEKFLRENNCISSYRIKVHSCTIIDNSRKGGLENQEGAAVVMNSEQERAGNTPGTSEGRSSNPINESIGSNKGFSSTIGPGSSKAIGSSSKSQAKRATRNSAGEFPLEETPKSCKASSAISVPGCSKAVESQSADSQAKGAKRKSEGESPLQETPKLKKIRGPVNTPTDSKEISKLENVKGRVGKNFTIAVKVLKRMDNKKKSGSQTSSKLRGTFEVADDTDVAIVKVYGDDNIVHFQEQRCLLIHNVWIRQDHIACTQISRVEKYKGNVVRVKDIKKKRREEEASHRKTLEEIKSNVGCKAAVRLNICKVGDLCYDKSGKKVPFRKLDVQDRKTSVKTYELVTFGKTAKMDFEVGKRYLFPSVTFNVERENFQTDATHACLHE